MGQRNPPRILLCIPNHGFRLENYTPFSTEHLGVAYLAAELHSKDYSTEILDAYLLNLCPARLSELLCERLADRDTACFTTTLETCTYVNTVCQMMRGGGFKGNVVVGGWGVALAPHSAYIYFKAADVLWCGWSASEFVTALPRIPSGGDSRRRLMLGTSKAPSPEPPRDSWRRPYHYVQEL